MKRAIVILIALGFLGSGTGQARAGILYNNLPAASTGAVVVSSSSGFGPLADSFSTGGPAVNLSDVKVLLELAGPPTGSIRVNLLSDASTSPGALLTTIGTINDNSLGSS